MGKLPNKLYCIGCKSKTSHIQKLTAVLNGNLICDICKKENPIKISNYKLVREDDGLTKYCLEVGFVEWEQGKFKNLSKGMAEIKINTSCLLSPFSSNYTWQTTPIKEIIYSNALSKKFKTKNSTYTLYKI